MMTGWEENAKRQKFFYGAIEIKIIFLMLAQSTMMSTFQFPILNSRHDH